MTPPDACLFAKLMAAHPEMDGNSIMLTVAFTPGSLSLSAYVLTPKGFEWGRQADPNSPAGYNPASMVDRAQLVSFGFLSLLIWVLTISPTSFCPTE